MVRAWMTVPGTSCSGLCRRTSEYDRALHCCFRSLQAAHLCCREHKPVLDPELLCLLGVVLALLKAGCPTHHRVRECLNQVVTVCLCMCMFVCYA